MRLGDRAMHDFSWAALVKPQGKSEIQLSDVIRTAPRENALRKMHTWKHTEQAGSTLAASRMT